MTFSDRRLLLAPALACAAALPCLVVVAPAAASAPAPVAAAPSPRQEPSPALEPVRLRPDREDRAPGARPGRAVVETAAVAVGPGSLRGWRTDGFRQVGATWDTGDPRLHVRTRPAGGRWSAWQELPHLHDGPDPGSPEATAGGATDLWWAGAATDVQLRVQGPRRGLELVLIDPGSAPADGTARPASASTSAASASTAVPAVAPASSAVPAVATASTAVPALATAARAASAPMPRIFRRKRWGADESWRSGAPRHNTRLQQVHVHHTVNTNAYGRDDVAPMIRGMYRYHTQSLGWSDLGYNFLVDRFGRTWEGRAGGLRRKVRGAHTLGFNETSTGVAVIGNFDTGRAPKAAKMAVVKIAAWKLDAEGHRPAGTARVQSYGSDRYARGARPRLPRIAGHRDTNDTACPGRFLYADLAGIRRYAQRRAARFS